MKKQSIIMLACIFLLAACQTNQATIQIEPESQSINQAEIPIQKLKPFDDARYLAFPNDRSNNKESYTLDEYIPEDIYTYWFNQQNIFLGNENLQAEIIEKGKNPGLGVRVLHKQGITGAGVNVAIIDQPLLLDHPEYNEKIVAYHTVGMEEDLSKSSMHGPAVTSLLAGENIGTAPGVNVYYVAFPSWDGDAKFGAEALDWIVEQNRLLSEDQKIRVVSASVDFSGSNFVNGDLWEVAVQAANQEGILVLDARKDSKSCLIWPSYYDYNNPESVADSKIGGAKGDFQDQPPQSIAAPISYRTTAEYYKDGEPSYAYDAEGGHSWAIPYGAGILALGWQVNPVLTGGEISKILFDTAYVDNNGNRFIHPTNFIEAVRKTLQ